MLSQEDIDNIINTIVRHYRPDKIILFGSYAQGNPTEDSDLDLLVIKDSDLPRYKRAREIHKLFNPYPVAMDILVYSNKEIEKWRTVETSFVHEALKRGVVVYA